MGACFSSEPEVDFTGPVDFYHFHILRAIGKGAFGKVCIVKKRDTKQMYAMKYMNKVQIIKKHAVENVFREINILQTLEHPFLVNLWFTFQDREDIFMVLDLMLGGDLSYHLEKEGRFQVARVRLYVAELALVLEYLRSRHILHRDVKPANMLLDSQGHVHLTDFNVACVVKPNSHITSITGTKPYMAPEVVNSSSGGYSYPVDWWSLGVSAYEMLRGQRPFVIERHTSNEELYTQLRHTRPSASARWDQHTCDVLKLLLHPEEDKRLQSVEKMKELNFFESVNWVEVEEKETTPPFVPPQNRINCDPTYELEEMIVEPNPLHKKQHRLSKRRFKNEDDEMERELDKIERRFKVYSRELEKEKPVEAETGKETGTSKTGASVGSDTNSHKKERSHDHSKTLGEIREEEETKEAPEKARENEKAENVDKEMIVKGGEKLAADKDKGTGDKVTVENEDNNRVEKQDEEMLKNQETKDGDKGTVGKESKEEVEVEVHENEVGKETAASVEGTSSKKEGLTLQNSTSDECVPETQNNLEWTDSGLQASEGDSNVSPHMPEGNNLDSFSSVKHLLS